MRPLDSTARKIARAKRLARSGRVVSLRDVAVRVGLSETTLRCYGVRLPTSSGPQPSGLPDTAEMSSEAAWRVTRPSSTQMPRSVRRCVDSRAVIAEELTTALNTDRRERATAQDLISEVAPIESSATTVTVSGYANDSVRERLAEILPEAVIAYDPIPTSGGTIEVLQGAYAKARRRGFALRGAINLQSGRSASETGHSSGFGISCDHRRCRNHQVDSVEADLSGVGTPARVALHLSRRGRRLIGYSLNHDTGDGNDKTDEPVGVGRSQGRHPVQPSRGA